MKVFSIFLTFFMFSCTSSKTLVSAKVLYVDENIFRIVAINCEDFDKGFKSIIKEKIITEKNILNEINNYLHQSKSDTSVNHIDVRTKILLYYNNKSWEVICFDKFNHAEYNGRFVIVNEDFFRLIRRDLLAIVGR